MPSHTPKHTDILPLRSGNLKKKKWGGLEKDIDRQKSAGGK